MATIAEIKELALHAARGTAPANFSKENVNEAFIDSMKELCGSVNKFMKNRYDIYEIMVDTIDRIVPKKIEGAMAMFADIRQVPNGQKVTFRRRIGKTRAKQFITQVAASGVYETFRLDSENVEIPVKTLGGAGTVDFERMLSGAESLAEIMEVLAEGLSDAIFKEVAKAMYAAFGASSRPTANKVTGSSFSASDMVGLVNVVKAYGTSAAIFAEPEFIAAMGADAIVAAAEGVQGIYSPDDIAAIHDTGLIRVFRGTPVIELPQSYTDENNNHQVFNPQYAFVLPTGGEKVVKVVFEGETQINDFKNRDNSIEVDVYKKMGVGILTQYNWGIYKNTGVTSTYQD